MEGDLAKLREWSKRFEVFASQQALGGATNPMEMKVYLLSRRKMSKMNINAVSAKYMYISIYMFYHMSYICIYVYIYICIFFWYRPYLFFPQVRRFPICFFPRRGNSTSSFWTIDFTVENLKWTSIWMPSTNWIPIRAWLWPTPMLLQSKLKWAPLGVSTLLLEALVHSPYPLLLIIILVALIPVISQLSTRT